MTSIQRQPNHILAALYLSATGDDPSGYSVHDLEFMLEGADLDHGAQRDWLDAPRELADCA